MLQLNDGYILVIPISDGRYRVDFFDHEEALIRSECHNTYYDCIDKANFVYTYNWQYLH